MRDTSSTVGQELELARGYLGIACLRVGTQLVVDVDTEPEVADARMPPMMLLPLMDHALAHGGRGSTASASLRIRATAARSTRTTISTRKRCSQSRAYKATAKGAG